MKFRISWPWISDIWYRIFDSNLIVYVFFLIELNLFFFFEKRNSIIVGRHIINLEQRKWYNKIDSFIKIGYMQFSKDIFIHDALSFYKDEF